MGTIVGIWRLLAWGCCLFLCRVPDIATIGLAPRKVRACVQLGQSARNVRFLCVDRADKPHKTPRISRATTLFGRICWEFSVDFVLLSWSTLIFRLLDRCRDPGHCARLIRPRLLSGRDYNASLWLSNGSTRCWEHSPFLTSLSFTVGFAAVPKAA